MKMSAPVLLAAIVVPVLAALGGALMVYAGYDDSPGGSLMGMLLVLATMVFSVRAARRRA